MSTLVRQSAECALCFNDYRYRGIKVKFNGISDHLYSFFFPLANKQIVQTSLFSHEIIITELRVSVQHARI